MFAAPRLRLPGLQLASRHAVPTLPSALRSRTRAFHATAPRKEAVDVLTTPAHGLLEFLHMGLPWWAAIPASALVLRCVLVGSMGIYTRKMTARFTALAPLRNAIAIGTRDRMMRDGSLKGFKTPREARLAIVAEIKKETDALNKHWDSTLYWQLFWTYAQIPIFMTMSEVIRRMIGTQIGLVGMAADAGTNLLGAVTNLVGWTKPAADPDVLSADPAVSTMLREYGADVALNPWHEPSLAHEGMLWFSNLTVPDPVGALPFIVSILMFTNIYRGQTALTPSTFQRRLRKTLLCVSVLIGPLCQAVPAGLMLYWASSTTCVMLSHAYMDWKYPIAQGFAPCKRPLYDYSPPQITSARAAAPPKGMSPRVAAPPKGKSPRAATPSPPKAILPRTAMPPRSTTPPKAVRS